MGRKKITVILLNGLFLPIGGVALGTVCAQPANKSCFGQREGVGVGQKIILHDKRGGELGKNIFS